MSILESVINRTLSFIYKKYNSKEIKLIEKEIFQFSQFKRFNLNDSFDDFLSIQFYLSNVNEKTNMRKSHGIYYTPNDLTHFIFSNTAKLLLNNLNTNYFDGFKINNTNQIKKFCSSVTCFDPTCGSGEFLISALELKFQLSKKIKCTNKKFIHEIIKTVYGNDKIFDSIVIAKIRIMLLVLEYFGPEYIKGFSKIVLNNFYCQDFLKLSIRKKFHIIIGNPPYVEIGKKSKYGNLYADCLDKSLGFLSTNGTIGFVIPLSYISTNRMKDLRLNVSKKLSKQIILSYNDRPDCLFSGVHQKLCVLIGKAGKQKCNILTSNYQYWYKSERSSLFSRSKVFSNPYATTLFIPKIGNQIDLNIYKKVIKNKKSISKLFKSGTINIYLNMRGAFWVKAFLQNKHITHEYKCFKCKDKALASLAFCLLHSSLFWWFWVLISDCWHITNKELNTFKIPSIDKKSLIKSIVLANSLEKKLEETKVYVCTKQTDYIYKHKDCLPEIEKINDFVNKMFGLNKAESEYVNNFAFKYRVGGGK